MAGFITARDGVYNVINDNIVGASSGYFKKGYKFDKRDPTNESGEGYPYFTVSPSAADNSLDYKGTVNTWSDYTVITRIFYLYDNTETNETNFLTLLDLTLTTLLKNSNITLSGTVQNNLVGAVKVGYNDDTQPTLRIAEIEGTVTQRHDRST